jgi:4-amino-4-deoxy-L-arabinose transferase-like glycosyltransferase
MLALLAGATLRAVMARTCSPFGSDSFQYLELARGLAERGVYESRGSEHPDLSRYPLYPALIAAGMTLGASAERSARAVTFLASLLLAFPAWSLARSLFGRTSAFAAVAIVMVSCAAADVRFALPDPLAALLYLSTAAAAWSTAKRGGLRRALAAGVFGGLASLARAEGVFWGVAGCGFLAFHALLARRRRSQAWLGAGLCAAIVLAAYGSYVSAVSAHLGRTCLFPGVDYLQSVREVADRYGVRRFPLAGVPWEDRALFLLDRDRTRFVLAEHFATHTFLPADPRWDFESAPPPEGAPAPARIRREVLNAIRLRTFILTRTLGKVPGTAWSAHLVTPVLLLLGTAGAAAAMRSRRGRRGVALLVGIGALGLAPAASHLESRFLLTTYAAGCLLAARGWSALDLALARAPRLRVPVHAAVAVAIVSGTWHHVAICPRPLSDDALYREAGAVISRTLPEGPLLATRPHVAWFADRPFRRLPLGGGESVADYFRSIGAAGIVINVPNESSRRADLGPLLELPPPPGFRLLARIAGEGGREVRVLAPEERP